MNALRHAALLATLLALAGIAAPAHAGAPPLQKERIDIVERLGDPVPRDLPFLDAEGRPVRLGDLLAGRPVVVALVYHRCQSLCGLLLGALVKSLRANDDQLGRDVDVVTVSIDPAETPALAAASRTRYLEALDQPATAPWAALTGPGSSIDALAAALGSRFQYVDAQREFAHVAALFVLTPQGRISRYLYDVEVPPRQLQAAVFEASGGRVGTSFDRILLRCFSWDPASRRYQLFLSRYFRVSGLALLGGVGALLAVLWRRDLRRRHA